MSSRRSSGSRFPPLSLDFPPPFPSSSSSSTSSNTRIDPGAGILPPPRSRTPSLAGSSFNPSSTFFSSSYRPLSSLDPNNYPSRHGAFSVPPPAFPSSSSSQGKATSSSSNSGITSRMVVCLPCRRGHLKCGKGMRPCQMCIKKGRVEECMEGVPPEQAKLFLRVYYEKKEKELAAGPSLSRPIATPIFDDDPLFPPLSLPSPSSSSPIASGSLLGGSSAAFSSGGLPSFGQIGGTLTYPQLGQLDDDEDMAPQLPVTIIMGQDLRIGRASKEALRTLGYHSHEMVNQALASYLPITEREKWKTFSGKLFTSLNPAGAPLPVTPMELSQLPIEQLATPVANMRSITSNFHVRRHGKEQMSVRIELWFGSYFGATVEDWKTFAQLAIVIARVTPLHGNMLPRFNTPVSSIPSVFPSVLLPPPSSSSSSSSSSFETFAAPRRNRTPSVTMGQDTFKPPRRSRSPSVSMSLSSSGGTSSILPPLSSSSSNLLPLPPLSSMPGGLPPLPSLNMTPRKRRTSTSVVATSDNASPTSSTLFPASTSFMNGGTSIFDHGSGLGSSTTRPRLRPPSPLPGHRRSLSSEAGQSSSDESLTSPSYNMSSNFPSGNNTSISMVFPTSVQRPPSRGRNLPLSYSSQFDGGTIPSLPKFQPESPSKSFLGQNLPYSSYGHAPPAHGLPRYKGRKQSYIAIDDSFDPPSLGRGRTTQQLPACGDSTLPFTASISTHERRLSLSSLNRWSMLPPLPDSLAGLSLNDSPNSSQRGSPLRQLY